MSSQHARQFILLSRLSHPSSKAEVVARLDEVRPLRARLHWCTNRFLLSEWAWQRAGKPVRDGGRVIPCFFEPVWPEGCRAKPRPAWDRPLTTGVAAVGCRLGVRRTDFFTGEPENVIGRLTQMQDEMAACVDPRVPARGWRKCAKPGRARRHSRANGSKGGRHFASLRDRRRWSRCRGPHPAFGHPLPVGREEGLRLFQDVRTMRAMNMASVSASWGQIRRVPSLGVGVGIRG